MKTLWGNKASKVWLIVSAVILVLILAVNIAANAFFDTICIVLNSPQRTKLVNEQTQYAVIEGYDTKEKAAEYGAQVTELVAREGFILLKNLVQNGGNALPLAKGAKVSVFGKNSVSIAYGGSGSGGGSDENAKSIFDSLTAAGFEYNPVLLQFYNDKTASGNGRPQNSGDLDSGKVINSIPTGETPWASYTDQVKASFADYNDAALVVITRIGGEGFDMARSYLRLDENEQTLIDEVSKCFDKVIVLLNVATSMEINDLAADERVSAILWMGFPGSTGMMALGTILSGEVNPSGRTVDTFATLESNPTWNNFGGEIGMTEKYSGDAYLQSSGRLGNVDTSVYFVDEEEGIYVGYRYYETAYAEAQSGHFDGFSYDDAVAYPFGYGLSYTNFDWQLKNVSALPQTFAADTPLTVEVEVTNDRSGVAGRDVVELYVTPPYTRGGIEKPAKLLVGFAKTEVLQPGESQLVTITVDSPYAFASYDCYDRNQNGNKGYEVEAGAYVFTISTDAHHAKEMENASFTVQVAQDIFYKEGAVAGVEVGNLYTDNQDPLLNVDSELSVQLSRSDFAATWPTSRTEAEKKAENEFIEYIKNTNANPNNPAVYTELPAMGADTVAVVKGKNGATENRPVRFGDLVGLDYNDELWDAFMDRLTLSEMIDLVNKGAFTTVSVERLDVPVTRESDGPVGWVNFMPGISDSFKGCCAYCCESLLAATWNIDRLYDMGTAVSNEGLVGYAGMPFSGWYAPGINIHRSPLGGRNFEYYSEDPLLGGMMAASLMKGLARGGVFANLKHFALNEQETHRSVNGVLTWSTEQAMRELYLKSFEIAIKTARADYTPKADGERVSGGKVKSMGVMSSFNRIGTRWAGGDYRLLTTILRDEWGFEGLVISDFNTCSHMVVKDMVYAGGDLNLEMVGYRVWSDADKNNAADVSVLRAAARNILYTVANSNAYRGEFVMVRPLWQSILIYASWAIVACLVIWGIVVVGKPVRARIKR